MWLRDPPPVLGEDDGRLLIIFEAHVFTGSLFRSVIVYPASSSSRESESTNVYPTSFSRQSESTYTNDIRQAFSLAFSHYLAYPPRSKETRLSLLGSATSTSLTRFSERLSTIKTVQGEKDFRAVVPYTTNEETAITPYTV